MTDNEKTNESSEYKEEIKKSNTCLATGAGVGAYGVGVKLSAGYFCPLCLIAAPAFLGVGVYKRWKAKQRKTDDTAE